MNIILNGSPFETSDLTLAELIKTSGLDAAALVAEVNLEIIQEKKWQDTRLNEGDRVELLQFVGGG